MPYKCVSSHNKGAFQKLLCVFSAKWVAPHTSNGKSFRQKNLSGNGSYPPRPLKENRRNFLQKMGHKGLKLAFFGLKQLFFSGFFP